jgi:hypothetical protein
MAHLRCAICNPKAWEHDLEPLETDEPSSGQGIKYKREHGYVYPAHHLEVYGRIGGGYSWKKRK